MILRNRARIGLALATGMMLLPAPTAIAATPAPGPSSGGAAVAPVQATTAVEPVKVTFELTPQQLDEARERARANKDRKASAPAPFQTEKRNPAHNSGKGKLTLKEAANAAAKSVAKAHGRPLKMTGAVEDGATPLAAPSVSTMAAGYPIGTAPPADLAGQCFGQSAETFSIFFNRYTHCSRVPIIADYYEKDPVTGQRGDHLGTSTARMEIFAQTYTTTRSVRLFAKIQKDSVSYDWGWWDNIWTAPEVPLSLIGQCTNSADVCAATRSAATLSWGNWNNNVLWNYWNVNNLESSGIGRDKVSANGAHMEFFTDDAKYDVGEPGRTAPNVVRCDSATYFESTRPQSCVFLEIIPHLTYSKAPTSNHAEVAQHIHDAFANPNATYPRVTAPATKKIPGQYIPGNYQAPGLHRITEALHPTESAENTAHKDGACYGTGKYAGLYAANGLQPRPDTSTQQCDEFPFRSTLEGAASPNWDFSVRAVTSSHNSSAGGMLPAYYRDDRVLAWDATLPYPNYSNDRFYVRISD